MTIKIGSKLKINNPTNQDVDDAVRSFIRDDDSFIILSHKNSFIQCAGTRDVGYTIECKAGKPLSLYSHHSKSIDSATLVKLFQEFNSNKIPSNIISWETKGKVVQGYNMAQIWFFVFAVVLFVLEKYLPVKDTLFVIVASPVWAVYLYKYWNIILTPVRENHPRYFNSGAFILIMGSGFISVILLVGIIKILFHNAP